VVEGPDETFALRSLRDIPIGAFFVLAAASVAITWRRRWPLAVLAATIAAASASSALGYSELIGVASLIALYSVGRYVVDERWSYVGVGGVLVLTVIISLVDDSTATETGFGLVVMFGIWYVGRRMQFRSQRGAELERERASEARRMVVEERTRIARELHDVVAHSVSLMTVQAGAAKTIAAKDPEGAQRAMAAVEQAGRQTLNELRHLLDVLRPEAGVNGLGPQPGLAEVARLTDQFVNAGLDVSVTVGDIKADLPARVDLFTYRIVQEALTNVLKHGGRGARAEVRIVIDESEVVIEVLDDGLGSTNLPGSGRGIVGMRERAMLLGGSLEAGPRAGGGFRVVAHLPLEDEPV
jgi:signal transduction histidine kinase